MQYALSFQKILWQTKTKTEKGALRIIKYDTERGCCDKVSSISTYISSVVFLSFFMQFFTITMITCCKDVIVKLKHLDEGAVEQELRVCNCFCPVLPHPATLNISIIIIFYSLSLFHILPHYIKYQRYHYS